jgi:DNA (cytosine-5)-methyltransferase 1
MRTVWQCEKDEYRRRVLARHWPDIERWDDVRAVSMDALRRRDVHRGRERGIADSAERQRNKRYDSPDLLCGGFPCQDLSVAGRRKGLEGDRSGLFYEFARIADELRPRWLMVENVPGLLSSADGRDFAIVLRTLADIGYGLAWRVLDARYFGVPQRRRRVFIVGHLGGDPSPAVLALGAGGEGDLEASRCSWQNAPQRASNGAGVAINLRGRDGGAQAELDSLASLRAADGGSSRSYVAPTLGRSYGDRGVDLQAPHVVTQVSALQAPNGGHLIAAPLTKGSATGEGVNPPGRRQEDDVNLVTHSITLASDPISARELAQPQTRRNGDPGTISNAQGVRRLTPTECERLMSWPDGWTIADENTADSRRYAACGDGVVSNVAEWIGRRIMAVDALETANPRPEGRRSVDSA